MNRWQMEILANQLETLSLEELTEVAKRMTLNFTLGHCPDTYVAPDGKKYDAIATVVAADKTTFRIGHGSTLHRALIVALISLKGQF